MESGWQNDWRDADQLILSVTHETEERIRGYLSGASLFGRILFVIAEKKPG